MKQYKVFLILCTIALSAGFHAQAKVVIEETIDIQSASKLFLEVDVGQVEINTHNSDEVVIDVTVKEADGHWFSSTDLDNIQLSQENSNNTLYLSIDAQDTNQEWKITLPEKINLELKMGVGEITANGLSKDIDIHLGVGDTEIELAEVNYATIELETGVGDADLHGFSNQETSRTLVSKSVEWQGSGKHEIKIDVGVGDVDVSQ